jgi:hypothetical protein
VGCGLQGNIFENLYCQKGFDGVDEGDDCAFVWCALACGFALSFHPFG